MSGVHRWSSQVEFTGNSALKTTKTLDAVGKKTGYYTIRKTDASITTVQTCTLNLPTSFGSFQIPNIGGSLTLTGKDSKIHVVDYTAGTHSLIYSTGEMITWYETAYTLSNVWNDLKLSELVVISSSVNKLQARCPPENLEADQP
ncbi:hypothetical protein GALMADRAFT_134083 [Galerina marginata CBS 339.88]|uniref:Beta-galactosidase domain-containing protein n=1 Tax=Galerina marginata (strain CBS 339.88) TaxID=685588 RepID=A0A067TJJ6_GALM3|nr:hypothetical protein GALMADRAFT_134083 [Galerina marginata CBS 339.88]